MKQLIRRWFWLIVLSLAVAIAIWHSTVGQASEPIAQRGSGAEAQERVAAIERTWKQQYEYYLGRRLGTPSLDAEQIAATLARLSSETNKRLALLYVFPHPNELELVLIRPGQPPIRKTFAGVSQQRLRPVADEFRFQVSRPLGSKRYLASAKQLYDWIIAPINSELAAQEVDALVFCMGAGLRSLPVAALWDGDAFLIEHYSVAVIPAFNLTNSTHRRISNLQVLAMGASEFPDQSELPAVPLELRAIAQELGTQEVFLNQDFTLDNLRQQLETQQYGIVHLATHAEFNPGTPNNSFIQFWQNERLRLDQVRQLDWSDLPVELLVLSACQTALGNPQAEMGFAGLSYHSGVKSTLASLWQVSDVGTLALMREFYWQLTKPEITTKAEALRQAQLSLLRGQVQLSQGQLEGPSGLVSSEELEQLGQADFSIPYYWSAFSLVGSPW
jgi:CHAT domain-containing protein